VRTYEFEIYVRVDIVLKNVLKNVKREVICLTEQCMWSKGGNYEILLFVPYLVTSLFSVYFICGVFLPFVDLLCACILFNMREMLAMF
jgi:hypothetical protein